MKSWIGILLISLLAKGCIDQEGRVEKTGMLQIHSYTSYATGFEVVNADGYKILHVYNPWQQSKDITFSYVLGGDPGLIPDSLGSLPFIRIPVSRIVTLSTTHIAMVDLLGKIGCVRGISGAGLIYNCEIQAKLECGEVLDVGYDQALNYESIVAISPDVLFLYGVESGVQGISEKLGELGVDVVFCGDYLERHPLGKAEWIRFFSLFFQEEAKGRILFEQIDSSYNSLCSMTENMTGGPNVLTGLPWKDIWYMAGGSSYAARLIQDAGGNFLWKDSKSAEALPMGLESVYDRAINADIWINPGAATSLDELEEFEERFKLLQVMKEGQVFNNNARLNGSGGNDYWESGVVHPDWILADLIKIFHPELMADHHYIYYKKLK